MMHNYQAFQLSILSELAFPELLAMESVNPDVTIRFGLVSPWGVDAPLNKGVTFQAKEGMFWLNVPNVARFLVTDGKLITIDPVANSDEDSIRVFLLGSCLGALLMQRGLFLLHGNAIQINQHAISFVGLSGSGKSTLSAIFLKRGYSILADDVCAINAQNEVLPSFPQIKLWADAAHQLLIETGTFRKIRPNIEKYAVPIHANFYHKPLLLKGVYILKAHNKEEINIEPLNGVEKFQLLQSQAYRRAYVSGLSLERRHKLTCGQLASRINLARLTRPNSGYCFDVLADHLESDFARQELGRG